MYYRHMVYYQWDDPLLVFLLLAHHGVGLSCASLPIGKDTHIISLKSVQKHFLPNVFIHLHLTRIVDIFWLFKTERETHDIKILLKCLKNIYFDYGL